MKLRKLIGFCLIAIGSIGTGYMLGGIVNIHCQSTLAKAFLFLIAFGSGICLIVKNRKCLSDVL